MDFLFSRASRSGLLADCKPYDSALDGINNDAAGLPGMPMHTVLCPSMRDLLERKGMH